MKNHRDFRPPTLKNKVDFKQRKFQVRNNVSFIDTDLWTSIVEGTFKLTTISAN